MRNMSYYAKSLGFMLLWLQDLTAYCGFLGWWCAQCEAWAGQQFVHAPGQPPFFNEGVFQGLRPEFLWWTASKRQPVTSAVVWYLCVCVCVCKTHIDSINKYIYMHVKKIKYHENVHFFPWQNLNSKAFIFSAFITHNVNYSNILDLFCFNLSDYGLQLMKKKKNPVSQNTGMSWKSYKLMNERL